MKLPLSPRSSLRLALALLPALTALPAAAQHSLYIGGAYFDIASKADALQGGPATPAPGVRLRVGDAATVGFGYVYRPVDRWAVELALGVPPAHKVYGEGVIQPFGQIASVGQVCPTVFVNYHLGQPGDRVRPLVGLGLNHTRFQKMRSTASGDAASGGPTTIELSDSWGLAAHAGAVWQLDPQWSVVGTVAAADVRSDLRATTRTASGEVVRTTRIDFRPVVYSLSLGYSF
ncbi:outer membrane protein [Sphaerotilus hippei]|uniref:Outer membrane protein n=1 Tax=Sphaerotilus hippei TaxID=744406 RepID=A0A318GVT7_9BURK|nr:OmpW family outer membrane protein [Sphaerotilus hippei]PXW93678.1 outer membrane protein [Sphaerotilus hippei]